MTNFINTVQSITLIALGALPVFALSVANAAPLF
jgi:hypothetical protein